MTERKKLYVHKPNEIVKVKCAKAWDCVSATKHQLWLNETNEAHTLHKSREPAEQYPDHRSKNDSSEVGCLLHAVCIRVVVQENTSNYMMHPKELGHS